MQKCSGLMSDGLFRRIISPSVYHGKIIFSREIRLSNVTLLLIHNCVCKRKNWRIHCNQNNDCPSAKTLSEIRLVWSKLSTYCIFKFSCEIIFQTVQEYRYENILNSTGNSFMGKYSQTNIFQWFQELGPWSVIRNLYSAFTIDSPTPTSTPNPKKHPLHIIHMFHTSSLYVSGQE
jgi:hypothetical protein